MCIFGLASRSLKLKEIITRTELAPFYFSSVFEVAIALWEVSLASFSQPKIGVGFIMKLTLKLPWAREVRGRVWWYL
jgi:hypothetical protein